MAGRRCAGAGVGAGVRKRLAFSRAVAMLGIMPDETTQLREEVARLRRDLDLVLKMLDLTDYEHIAPKPPERLWLTVENLRVVSEDGRRSVMEMGCEGSGGVLALYDSKERCRAELRSDDFGAELKLINADGKTAVLVNVPNEHGQVGVFSPDGKGRAVIKSSKIGGVVNVMRDNGRPGVFMQSTEEGGKLGIVNRSEKDSVSLYTDDDGNGIVRVHEASGETMAALGASADSGVVTVWGSLGEQAVMLVGVEDGGRVLVCDEHGGPKAFFPGPPPTEG